ncbi:MAG: hypothetical protein Q9M25_04640, partial [Mariprofundaceae bacterium]|nr:hypothetical protein [Mariprofundaceae bacterium]
ISSTAQHSTEGHYYAETAVNYMIWAFNNDAEFDSYDYGSGALLGSSEPTSAGNASSVGDKEELNQKVWDPGPTVMRDASANLTGQVMYFDNTPLTKPPITNRAICTGSFDPVATSAAHYFSSCVNLQDTPGNRYAPSLYQISTRLPRYIVLEIDSSGVITPSIPVLPHPTPPIVSPLANASVPKNGAIVWLTTGNSRMDFEVDPSLGTCNAGARPPDAMGCDAHPPTANPDGWLRSVGTLSGKEDQYGVVVYAIGYVNGRPSSIIRAQIR